MKAFGKKIAAVACAAAMAVSVGILPAFAENPGYGFSFSGFFSSQQETGRVSKADSDEYLHITISDSYNWTPGVDRVYMWAKDNSNRARTSDNNYYVRYVTDSRVQYANPKPSKGEQMRLVGWHNNNGYIKSFTVWGRWNP